MQTGCGLYQTVKRKTTGFYIYEKIDFKLKNAGIRNKIQPNINILDRTLKL